MFASLLMGNPVQNQLMLNSGRIANSRPRCSAVRSFWPQTALQAARSASTQNCGWSTRS